jgi:glycosyltransferase involved in cell wall biosynthesis
MSSHTGVLILTPWYPTPDLPHRGIFVADQARALAGAGVPVTVLHSDARPFAIRGTTVWPARAEAGVAVLQATRPAYLPRLEAAYAHTSRRLTDRLLARMPAGTRYDVLHAHVSYPTGAIAVELGRRWRLPVVITEHFAPFTQLIARPLARRRALWALGQADAAVAVSSALARDMAAAGLQRPVEVVPNVVDVSQFQPRPMPPLGPLKVIAIGSLIERKNPVTILEAAARFAAERAELGVRVTFVGSGPLESQLREQAQALGLADRVAFTGDLPRPDVARELAAHHLLAVASTSETFSVVAAEALASGRPVVTTRCGGPEDFVTPEVGEMVPIGDPGAMGAAWSRWADRLPGIDPRRIANLAESRFGPDRVAQLLLDLYDRCRHNRSVTGGHRDDRRLHSGHRNNESPRNHDSYPNHDSHPTGRRAEAP